MSRYARQKAEQRQKAVQDSLAMYKQRREQGGETDYERLLSAAGSTKAEFERKMRSPRTKDKVGKKGSQDDDIYAF